MGRVQHENAARPRPSARVALIHDFLLDIRGAERVFLELCRLWPEADLYTAIYDEAGTEGRFAGRNVYTSYLQRLRPSARTFRTLLPLYPSAIESLDLSGYELVISSSSAWAHAVLCDEQAIHVTYCHNPFRYVWNDRERTLARRRDPLSRSLLRGLFRRWRQWDWIAAQRSDRFLANSRITQSRVESYFGRTSTIVHPPVETERFSPGPVGSHYVLVSELMPHKEIDIAVEAFNHLRLPLVVVGDGPDYRRLRRLAGRTVNLAGRLTDADVAQLLGSARALVITAVEEFGIVAVESQAAGRPVIGRQGGGALETIVDGVTGCLWSGGPAELARAVVEFDDSGIDPRACVGNAARFGAPVFRRRLVSQVAETIQARSQAGAGEARLRAAQRTLRAAGSSRSR